MKYASHIVTEDDLIFPHRTSYRIWKRRLGIILTISVVALVVIYIIQLQGTLHRHRDFSSSILSVDRLEQAFYRMEAANNGFLLTANPAFREPFNRQRDIVSSNYKELLRLTSDDTVQQDRLTAFKAKFTQWFALYNPMILRLRTTQEAALGTPIIPKRLSLAEHEKLQRCQKLSDEIVALIDEIRATQERKAHYWENAGNEWFQIIPAGPASAPSQSAPPAEFDPNDPDANWDAAPPEYKSD